MDQDCELLAGRFAVGGVHWNCQAEAWYWVVREGLASVPAFHSLR